MLRIGMHSKDGRMTKTTGITNTKDTPLFQREIKVRRKEEELLGTYGRYNRGAIASRRTYTAKFRREGGRDKRKEQGERTHLVDCRVQRKEHIYIYNGEENRKG